MDLTINGKVHNTAVVNNASVCVKITRGVSPKKKDSLDLSTAYCEYAARTGTHQADACLGIKDPVGSDLSPDEARRKIEHLRTVLRQDEDFMNNKHRDCLDHSVGRKLISAIIMSDKGIQEEIAQRMWDGAARRNKVASETHGMYKPMYLPPDYHGYDIKAMLLSEDELTAMQPLIEYMGILSKKAQTTGLTDDEKMLSWYLEYINLDNQGTFDEKMEPVKKEIDDTFNEAGAEFDESKSLSKISRCAQRREIFSPGEDDLTRHTLCTVRKIGEVWRKKIRRWTCREILDRL